LRRFGNENGFRFGVDVGAARDMDEGVPAARTGHISPRLIDFQVEYVFAFRADYFFAHAGHR